MATTCSSSPSTSHSTDRFETYATTCSYNILSPQVAGNLSTIEYDGLFQIYKVIYPDYASHHYIEEIETLVVTTFGQRWAIFLNSTDFCLTVDTPQGHHLLLNQPHRSILDILNCHVPHWKTHQHCYAHPSRHSEAPHADASDTGFVVRIQSIPRGHPFFSHNAVM
jgi:hypothetical protein